MNEDAFYALWRQLDPAQRELAEQPGDHDLPYRFGQRPTTGAPGRFTERQLARLLVLRGEVQDARYFARGRYVTDIALDNTLKGGRRCRR
jgi:hypothetical protein